MHRTQRRRFGRPATLVATLVLLITALAAPAAAQPAPDGFSRPASGFAAGPGVRTLESRILVPGAGTQQASPPQSFCYVGVNPPTIHPDQRLTETWFLDCRSLADPNQPAPDIFMVLMDVRIFQGEPNPFEPGRELSHTSCSSGRTNPSCSSTTPDPLQFGVPYYTRLDVSVSLTGGANPTGSFVTEPIRLT
jgi:hypothetical protein